MNTWTVLKDFLKKNCLIKTNFYRSLKNRTTNGRGKKIRWSHN